jgi:hypothetical protein
MSEAHVRREFDSIAAFSEIEAFLDTPVKFYSSGMFLRLAFSVAIHTDPEVLILDEILAVGDLAFQLKCMDRMREIQAAGTTIVVVTHNLHTLDRTAPRAVLLSHGRLVYDGPTEQTIGRMHEVMQQESRDRSLQVQQEEVQGFAGTAEVFLDVVDENGVRQRTFATGGEIVLRVQVLFSEEVDAPRLGVLLAPIGLGTPVYTSATGHGEYKERHGPDRPLEAEIRLDNRLLAGGYTVTVAVHDDTASHVLGTTMAESFYVTSAAVNAGGIADLNARFVVGGATLEGRARRRLGTRKARQTS